MTDENELVLDLDAEREQRAAKREGKAQTMPIRLGGKVVATLPAELPVEVLEPLRNLDGDLTLIIRQAMQAQKANDETTVQDVTDLVIDVLANNPALPVQALSTVRKVTANLLTEDGLAAFMEQRPSPQDIAALAKGVFRFYGLSLGEASPSSDSSTDDGGTSSGTSSTTSGSMPEDSGTTPESEPSLEPAGS